jgi:DNA segregation ATPase FtsK/SpoIIIE, S-DNA-T family
MRKLALYLLGAVVGFTFVVWVVGVVVTLIRNIADALGHAISGSDGLALGLHIVEAILGLVVGGLVLLVLVIVGHRIFLMAMRLYRVVRLVIEGCRWAVLYVCSKGSVRLSVRQAVAIRLGWRRLARMLSLRVQDGTRLRSSWAIKDGRPARKEKEVPNYLVPSIRRLGVDEYGVLATIDTVPGVGQAKYTNVADDLANAWGMTRVAVRQERPGSVVIRAVREDPLTRPYQWVPDGKVPVDLRHWSPGRDEYADPIVLNLGDQAGMVVGGTPGRGKTSCINGLLSYYAPSPAVQFAVVDGKGPIADGDYQELLPRLAMTCGDNLNEAARFFEELADIRRARAESIRRVLGRKNFWGGEATPEWPLLIVIVDECHRFLADPKGRDKDAVGLIIKIRDAIEQLVKLGRSVGIFTVLATQRPTSDSLPTSVRDNAGLSLSFGVRTVDSAIAVLGDEIRAYPDASPVRLQGDGYKGVAVLACDGRAGFVRVRCPLVVDEDAARIATATAELVKDPRAQLRPHVAEVEAEPSEEAAA